MAPVDGENGTSHTSPRFRRTGSLRLCRSGLCPSHFTTFALPCLCQSQRPSDFALFTFDSVTDLKPLDRLLQLHHVRAQTCKPRCWKSRNLTRVVGSGSTAPSDVGCLKKSSGFGIGLAAQSEGSGTQLKLLFHAVRPQWRGMCDSTDVTMHREVILRQIDRRRNWRKSKIFGKEKGIQVKSIMLKTVHTCRHNGVSSKSVLPTILCSQQQTAEIDRGTNMGCRLRKVSTVGQSW